MHWPKSSDEARLKVSGISEWVCGMGSVSESWDAPRRDQVPKSRESAVELHCRCVSSWCLLVRFSAVTVSRASAGRDCSSVAKGEKNSVAGLSCLRFFTGACQLDHGSGAPGVLPVTAATFGMSKDYVADVPSWNGDPGSFLAFETACRWYEKTLKEGERRGAAARVWSCLTGPARSVVKHLSPDEFDAAGGLEKLLQVLRASPLQTLPIPDSFSKLERWHSFRRKEMESIPELIVREDDLFRELQSSLLRSRARKSEVIEGPLSPPAAGTPKAGAAASPSSAKDTKEPAEDEGAEGATVPEPIPVPIVVKPAVALGFFEDELRGYRLLKAAGLSNDQRMQILTLNLEFGCLRESASGSAGPLRGS